MVMDPVVNQPELTIVLLRTRCANPKPLTVHSFVEAEVLLRGMASTREEFGGKDEVDYFISTKREDIQLQGRIALAERHKRKQTFKHEVLHTVARFTSGTSDWLGKFIPAAQALASQKSICEMHGFIESLE